MEKPQALHNIPLADFTTYRIGGPAAELYIPGNIAELQAVVRNLRDNDRKFIVIGGGSNVLIADRGISMPVILMRDCSRGIHTVDFQVICGSGEELGNFVSACVQAGLAGVEKLTGIPGTLGGALCMNAGAYGNEISEYLRSVTVVDEYGNLTDIHRQEIRFAYRSAPGLIGKIVIAGTFEFNRKDFSSLRNTADEIAALRKSKHPAEPSAGSVFKKHPLGPAGKLIEDAGLKGLRIGNAQISPKHANFIVNLGGAKAIEVLALIRKIQEVVFRKFYAELELEQRLFGFSDEELAEPESFIAG